MTQPEIDMLNFFEVFHNPINGEPYYTYCALPVYCTPPSNSKEITAQEYFAKTNGKLFI